MESGNNFDVPPEYIFLIYSKNRYIFYNDFYILKIKIPEEMEYIVEIIQYTEEVIYTLDMIISSCNNILENI